MSSSRWIPLVLCLLACGGGSTGPAYPPAPPPAPPPPPPPPPPPGGPGLTAAVQMSSSPDQYGTELPSFLPATVTIQRTGTVTWTNSSGVEHGVTFNAATGAPTNVAPPANGATVRSFPTAGDFTYYCPVHAGMSGRVVVQ